MLQNGTTKVNKRTKKNVYDTIRYDMRCYFNVRSKADISQLNLPHVVVSTSSMEILKHG